MSLAIRSTAEGIVFRIKVRPRSRRTGILATRAGSLLVGVAAPPERGKANDELVQVLAEALGLPRSAIEILSGHGHREKVVRCKGVSEEEARPLLES